MGASRISVCLLAMLAIASSLPLVAPAPGDEPHQPPAQGDAIPAGSVEPERPAPQLPRGPDVPGVASSPYLDFNRNRIYDDLDALLASSAPTRPLTVIVMTTSAVDDASIAQLRASLGDFKLNAIWQVVDGFSADMTPAQILQLATRPDVVQIERDQGGSIMIDTARNWYGADKAVTDFGVDGDRTGNRKLFSTTDVVICQIDTGIDVNHVDLNEGQLLGFFDYVNGQANAYDDNGHGTNVASIMVGQGDGSWSMRGVAYGAALVSIKVYNNGGTGTTTNEINGINWCYNNRNVFHVKIINMSGGDSGCKDGTDTLSTAANNAYTNGGLLFVASAGNDGPAKCTVGAPAVASNVIAVCNLPDVGEGGFYLWNTSSRGPTASGGIKPDVCAPGLRITAARANGALHNEYSTWTGTSQAAPFVSGIAALMLDANYALSASTLRSDILASTQDWGPSGKDSEYGNGRLLGYDAVRLAGGFSGTGPSFPTHFQEQGSILVPGNEDDWQFTLGITTYPISITLIIPNGGLSQDYDLALWRWTGSAWTSVSYSHLGTREEAITFNPTTTGTYLIQVYAFGGSTTYYLDLSTGTNTLSLTHDG